MTSQTFPSGRIVTTTYDTAGRVGGVAATARTYASSITYAAHGALKVMQLGNTLWEHTNFNSRLQPTQIGLGITSTSTSGLGLDYSYGTTNNNGNVLSQTITAPGLTQLTQFYAYDSLNRLEIATERTSGQGAACPDSASQWCQKFGYDAWGNRWVTSSSYMPNPSLTPQSASAFDTTKNRLTASQYDTAGNQTQDAIGRTFGYDLENRQTTFSGGAVTYGYDGEGRRVRKIDASLWTIFVYNVLGQLVAEYSEAAGCGTSGTSYLTADHLGSTRVITDGTQAAKKRYDYLPFGEEIPPSVGGRSAVSGYGATDCTRQKFTGKERDAESGLDYFGARYMSGAQGRFTSPDPQNAGGFPGDPQSWNAYAYARNNPLLYTDPTGEAYTICNVGGNCLDSYSDANFAKNFRKIKDIRLTKDQIFVKDADGTERLIGTYSRTSVDLKPEAVEILSRVEQLSGPTVRGLHDATMTFVTIFGPGMLRAASPQTLGTLVPITAGAQGTIIGWGTGQSAQAVLQTELITASLTRKAVAQMVARGLSRKWVEQQLAKYTASIAQGERKLDNAQLLVRKELMEKILSLWPN